MPFHFSYIRPTSLFSWLILILLALGFLPGMQPETSAAPPASAKGWKLILADEFSGSTPNAQVWTPHYSWGRTNGGNHEGEYYLDSHASVGKGILTLKAEPNPQMAEVGKTGKPFPYVSGMLSSHGKQTFRYGYFEIRSKLPTGKGIWPAFWLHKANLEGWLPEIDVMECLGHQPNQIHMTLHYEPNGQHQEQKCTFNGPDFHQGYHTFGVDWKPNSLTYYVDGAPHCHFTTGIPQEPMYIILNLAVGGDWPGFPDASTQFPQLMLVDYVRVYRENP